MTNSKSTKRALFSSVVALLLCFTMLLGTTFAWFTDSVTSANNIIKSGNLDVNLYYWDNSMATGTSVAIEDEPDLKLFRTASGEEILWEPGATGFGQFEVANEGSLALKYQLLLNFYDATETAEGKTLADVLSVYAVARNATTGDDGVMEDANLESLRTTYIDSYVPGYESQALTDFVLEGYLLPGESFKYELGAFWEPSDKDNEYNVAGGLSINFGVRLLATQMTYEEDVYDDQYDKDATYPEYPDMWDGAVDTAWNDASTTEYVINNAEELAGFAALVNSGTTFEGKTVKLNRDIDLRNKEWTPIGNSAAYFKGTFDGQGHTISNLTITNASATNRLGLFGYVENATIKNVTVKNTNISKEANSDVVAAVLISQANGSLALSNITINDANVTVAANAKTVYSAAIVSYAVADPGTAKILDKIIISDVEIDANAKSTNIGSIFGFFNSGSMTVTNATVDDLKINSNATTTSHVGGLFGYTHKGDPMAVENAEITNLDIDFTGNGESYAGGVIGFDTSVSRTTGGYKNISVSGTIDENISSGSGSSVGGFVGISYQYPKTFTDCTADVDVSGGNRAGGFVGTVAINAWSGQTEVYNNCTAKGDANGPYAGGFIGCAWLNASANTTLVLEGVKAEGTVAATNQGGGLIGSAWGSNSACSDIIIRNSIAAQTVTGPQVGGVVGAHSMGKGKTITLENVTSYITPEIR